MGDVSLAECNCIKSCKSTIYSSFVMNRLPLRGQPVPSSQIWLYYTTKMVNVSSSSFYNNLKIYVQIL